MSKIKQANWDEIDNLPAPGDYTSLPMAEVNKLFTAAEELLPF